MWVRRPQVTHCEALGAALARLHEAGADFPMHRPNTLSVGGWQALIESTRDRADEVDFGLGALIAKEYGHLMERWPRGLPEGVIHADLFPDNVFFLKTELSGMIDFYFACNDVLAYDLAICLNAWCFEADHSFNITKGQALLRGYQAVRRLTEAERTMMPLLARGAALRFLLTRAYDWLNTADDAFVKPKDPLEYARRLRFHQTITTAAGFGLAG
jgi:homoserine kinase type II